MPRVSTRFIILCRNIGGCNVTTTGPRSKIRQGSPDCLQMHQVAKASFWINVPSMFSVVRRTKTILRRRMYSTHLLVMPRLHTCTSQCVKSGDGQRGDAFLADSLAMLLGSWFFSRHADVLNWLHVFEPSIASARPSEEHLQLIAPSTMQPSRPHATTKCAMICPAACLH